MTSDDLALALAPHIQLHDRVTALYPKIRALGVELRPALPLDTRVARVLARQAPRTHEDAVICALVAKAANTHRSVRLLAEVGSGEDATALERVLMENAVLVEWLVQQPHRIGIYAMAEQVLRRWLVSAVRKLSTNRADLTAADAVERQPAYRLANVFGDVQTRHLFDLHRDGTKLTHVSAKTMVGAVSMPAHRTHDDGDLSYFYGSMFVHSSALSVRHLLESVKRGRVFDCEISPKQADAVRALRSANMWMAIAVSQLCEYAGLDELRDDLEALRPALFASTTPVST